MQKARFCTVAQTLSFTIRTKAWVHQMWILFCSLALSELPTMMDIPLQKEWQKNAIKKMEGWN